MISEYLSVSLGINKLLNLGGKKWIKKNI
jgi:hypothetical protein